jgi:hypothetical protein
MDTRPPLEASYSQHHTTLYVRAQAVIPAKEQAFVFCQWKKRACMRDSFSHGVHTALFNAGKVVRAALCLPKPTETMAFPPSRQGTAPQSPLRDDSESFMDHSA